MQKSPARIWITLAVVVGLLGLGAAAFFGVRWFTGSGAAGIPEIRILSPNQPPEVRVGEGVMLTVMARAGIGIDRIEWYQDGNFLGQRIPTNVGAEELLAQFAWMPEKVGAHQLSFVAYGTDGMPSDTANLPASVTAATLSEEDASAISEQVAAMPIDNVVESGASASGGSASSAASGQGGAQSEGESGDDGRGAGEGEGGQADDDREDGDDGVGEGRGESDLPPEIQYFDTSFIRAGNDVFTAYSGQAADDIGLEYVLAKVISHAGQELDDSILYHYSQQPGQQILDYTGQFTLSEGAYTIATIAVDSAGNPSAVVTKDIHVGNPQAGEGPGLAEALLSHDFLAGILGDALVIDQDAIRLDPSLGLGIILGNGQEVDQEEPDCGENCPPTSMDDVTISVEQFYYDNRIPRSRVTLSVPPNMQLDEYASPVIYVGFQGSNLGRFMPILMTPELQQSGIVKEMETDDVPCRGAEYSLTPLLDDGNTREVARGQPTTFTPIACAPPKSRFTQMQYTSACPDSDGCVNVTWKLDAILQGEGLQQPLSVDHFELEEIIYFFESYNRELTYELDPQQFTFTQTTIKPNRVYEYRIKAVAENGVHTSQDRINLRIPAPAELHTDVVTDNYMESR